MLTFADCLPILLVDPHRPVVGIAHAGWRGTVAGISPAVVAAMAEAFGSDPREMLATIGPGIGSCCYEVGREVILEFAEKLGDVRPHVRIDQERRHFLNLASANRQLLLEAGLRDDHIQLDTLCTACRTDVLYSHRYENGRTGRFAAIIGIRARPASA